MMERVSVGVKTFLRPDALAACLDSLRGYGWARVIIADDNPPEVRSEYDEVYERFEHRLPLRVLRLPFDVGLAEGRNEIVRHCETEYVLVLDDDQRVNESVRFLVDVLDADPRIGGVSCLWWEDGRWKCTACDLHEEFRHVIKELRDKGPEYSTSSGARYLETDFIPNSTLFRMGCLRDTSWDPFYKIGREHLDFFLTHKRLGRWRFTVCLDAYIHHAPARAKIPLYSEFRQGDRLRRSEEYFLKKFDVKGVIEGVKLIGGSSRYRTLRRLHVPGPLAVVLTKWSKTGGG